MDNNFNFDPMTGEPIVRNAAPEQPQYQAPQYKQPIYQQPSYQQPAYQQPVQDNSGKVASIVGMCLGIAGLVFSWFGISFFLGFIPLGMCITGLILTKRPPFTKPAKICGIIGLVLTGIFMLIGLVALAEGEYLLEEMLEELYYW